MKKLMAGSVVVAACAVAAGLFSSPARATTQTWDGDGTTATDDVTFGTAPVDTVPLPDPVPPGFVAPNPLPFKLWPSGDNWVSGTPAGVGDDAVFGPVASGGSMKVAILGNVQVQTITLNDTTPGTLHGFTNNLNYEFDPYSGAGNKITLGAGGTITQNTITAGAGSNSTPTTFRVPIDLVGSATINNNQASYLVMRGAITGLAPTRQTLTFNAPTNTISSSVISGNLDLVKTGTAALTMGSAATEMSPASAGSTYQGDTFHQAGTLILKVNNTLPVTTNVIMGTAAGATTDMRLDSIQQTVAGLSTPSTATGTIRVLASGSAASLSTLTVNNTTYNNFGGILGTGTNSFFNFVKDGVAGFTLSRAATNHPITGAITILNGAFEVEGSSATALNTVSSVTINGGTLLYSNIGANGLNPAGAINLVSGTIGGLGKIADAVSVGANSTISPGGNLDNTTGAFSDTVTTQAYSGGLTLASGGTYAFDVNTTTSDQINATVAAINVAASAGSPFLIDVNNIDLTPGTAYSRMLATSAAGVTNFDSAKFAVTGDATAASVSQSGNDLLLNFTAVQTVYWDINGSGTAGAGGATPSGNWNGGDVNFNTDATGGAAGSTSNATTAFNNVNFGAGTDATGSYTVTLTGTQSANAVNVDEGNVTLTGGTLDAGGFNVASGASATVASVVTGGTASAIVKRGAGTLTLSAANTHTGGTNVNEGTLVLGNADATAGGAINVKDGALAQAQAGLTKAVTVTTLATNTSGKFDLTNNSLVVKGMTDTAVKAEIVKAYNAGAWNGTGGLTSSTAAAATIGTTGIGYALNSDLGTLTEFKGVTPLAGTDVLVKYTYFGDADLDGDVDGNDVGSWAGNFTGSGGSSTKTWFQGDWDYDGDVDGNDVGLWAGNFTGSGGGILNLPNAQPGAIAALEAMGFTVVPEPASLGLIGLAGAGLLGRRRRAGN